MTIIESERPISNEELDALEAKYHFRLPEQYRAFLLRNNGGRPSDAARFRFLGVDGPYTDSLINWFLAVYDGEYDNFEKTFRALKLDRVRIPENMIPIADDPFGNFICISANGDDTGSVYFWDHEMEHGVHSKPAPTRKNVFLLAHSLNDFLAGL